MKPIFIACIFLLCLLSGLEAQSIISCTPNTAVTGQSLTVNIIGTSTAFQSASSTYLYNPTQSLYPSLWNPTSPTSITATYNIPPNAPLGTYHVVVNNGFPYSLLNGFTVSAGLPPAGYGQVSGKLYKDTNSNCTYNFGEAVYGNSVVTFTPGNFSTMSDALGNYTAWLPLGAYTARFVPFNPYAPTCPLGGTRSVTLATNGQVLSGQDFASNVVPFRDANVGVWDNALRPGFNSNIWVNVRNVGTQPILSGVVKFKKPSFTTLVSATPAPTSISGDTLIWNFANLPTFLNYSLVLNTPTIIPLGTVYQWEAWVNPSPIDDIVVNNAFYQQRVMTGAYDPNDKQVFLPSGQNADGDVLPSDSLWTYLVRFQNTGTDTAFNVFVRDTIDVADMDFGTFRMLGASHNYRLLTSGNGGQLEITFPNIMLPDSGANQAASNGYFMYQMKRRNNLPLGTIVPNSASIYFDFNAPVKTNTVHTRICDQVAANYASVVNGLSVQFTDQSTGTVLGRLWDFGDGTTSTVQNPTHIYIVDGNYQVCLITNGVCRADTACFPLVVCNTSPTASFAPGITGLNVVFNNTSLNALTCIWDFGDGNTSTAPSPNYTYALSGTYQVCLTTFSSCGLSLTNCGTVTVCAPTLAAMSPANAGAGTYNFSNLSTNATTWHWDFGDGATSTLQAPSHTYANDGSYNVCLIATSGCDADTICSTLAVCGVPVVASYTSSVSSLTANFLDNGSNSVSYAWDFGDGASSTLQNPTHTYGAIGTYQVCLTATSSCGGTDTHCSTVTVCVAPISNWSFTQPGNGTLSFSDASQYSTNWVWTFGDGAIAITPNATHTYFGNGTYTICLTASNFCGTDSSCTMVTVCPAPLQAAFASSAVQYTYQFADQSIGALSYAWDFGDGATSSLASPTHTYGANGTYNVCQTVTNLCGMTDVVCTPFTVAVVGIENPFAGCSITVVPNPMQQQATLWVRDAARMGAYDLHVYDLRGALIRTMTGECNEALVLDRGQLSAGMYIYRVSQGGEQLGAGRVVVE